MLLGVMSNPTKPLLRNQWREWGGLFNTYQRSVHVRYVLGTSFYAAGKAQGDLIDDLPALKKERERSSDFLVVNGRERLPHVGVVTEKSAAFWQAAAATAPSAKWFCKCDDDTLVNLDRLETYLKQIDREQPGRAVYFGHMKWRGWDVDDRFQACGGTWGDAAKTAKDILEGGIKFGDVRYPPCPDAAGPFPYMSGGMVCMSRPLAERMAVDTLFDHFLSTARRRNTNGVPCRKPALCAAQPPETHMWHHEDAGIGFNVFRAVVDQNTTALLIPVPAHYNDPGIIERSVPLDANDHYWSTRSVFVHGIKLASHFDLAKARWNLTRPNAEITLKCYPCDTLPPGVNKHYGGWEWARVPCPPRGATAVGVGRFCSVTPKEHFTCCTWPWDIPQRYKDVDEARRREARAAKRARRGV